VDYLAVILRPELPRPPVRFPAGGPDDGPVTLHATAGSRR